MSYDHRLVADSMNEKKRRPYASYRGRILICDITLSGFCPMENGFPYIDFMFINICFNKA